MLCSLGFGCLQHTVDLSDTVSWQLPNTFVCHVLEKQESHVCRIHDHRSLSAVANSFTPQRGMLARLAAHINQGQMVLGGGGEGAIVIDDNCTVSSLNEYGQLHNC
jgi:hypothetical protein